MLPFSTFWRTQPSGLLCLTCFYAKRHCGTCLAAPKPIRIISYLNGTHLLALALRPISNPYRPLNIKATPNLQLLLQSQIQTPHAL